VDICQILWVFAPIKEEEEAKTILLPKIIDPDIFQYPYAIYEKDVSGNALAGLQLRL
jgi:hypothetical protein